MPPATCHAIVCEPSIPDARMTPFPSFPMTFPMDCVGLGRMPSWMVRGEDLELEETGGDWDPRPALPLTAVSSFLPHLLPHSQTCPFVFLPLCPALVTCVPHIPPSSCWPPDLLPPPPTGPRTTMGLPHLHFCAPFPFTPPQPAVIPTVVVRQTPFPVGGGTLPIAGAQHSIIPIGCSYLCPTWFFLFSVFFGRPSSLPLLCHGTVGPVPHSSPGNGTVGMGQPYPPFAFHFYPA